MECEVHFMSSGKKIGGSEISSLLKNWSEYLLQDRQHRLTVFNQLPNLERVLQPLERAHWGVCQMLELSVGKNILWGNLTLGCDVAAPCFQAV